MEHQAGIVSINGWLRFAGVFLLGASLVFPPVAESKVIYKWLQLVEGERNPQDDAHLTATALVRAIVDHDDECPILYDSRGVRVTAMQERKREESLQGFAKIKLCQAAFTASDRQVQSFNEVFFDEKRRHKAVTLPDLSHGIPLASMVAYGCTGCRGGKAQPCTGKKKKWFFQEINEDAASRTGDGLPPLVIYMGDYRYSGQKEVEDSWTYATYEKGGKRHKALGWKQEVFEPIKDLMEHGMFVHQRGNHEGCYVKGNTWMSNKTWRDRGEGWLYFFGHGATNCERLAGKMDDMLPPFALDATVYGGTTKEPVVTGQKVRLAFLDTVRTGDDRDDERDLTRRLYKGALDRIDARALESRSDDRPLWIFSHIPAYGVKKGFESMVVLEALEDSTLEKNLSAVSLLGAAHIHLFGLINGGMGNPNDDGPFQFVIGNGGVALNKKGGKELSCQEDSVAGHGRWAGLKLAKLGYLHTRFDVENCGDNRAEVTRVTYTIPFFDEKTGKPLKTSVECKGSGEHLSKIYCPDLSEKRCGTPACSL